MRSNSSPWVGMLVWMATAVATSCGGSTPLEGPADGGAGQGGGGSTTSADGGAGGIRGTAGQSGPILGATITGLRFTTSSEFPTNPPPTDVDLTLTDPTPSLAIYRATLALPVAPSGPVSCPNDPGYRHTITFFAGQFVEATAVLNPEGCQDVTISGSSTTRLATDAYWTTLAGNLGIQRSTLFSLASTTIDPDGGVCEYPASVNVNSSPSGPGCFAGHTGQLCEGGSCRPFCTSPQYEMSCYDGSAPDAALGCQSIAIPTPSNVLFYCCPCAN
jgi:hypothetical protein